MKNKIIIISESELKMVSPQGREIERYQYDDIYNLIKNHEIVDLIIFDPDFEQTISFYGNNFSASEKRKIIKKRVIDTNGILYLSRPEFFTYCFLGKKKKRVINILCKKYNKKIFSIKSFLYSKTILTKKVIFIDIGIQKFWSYIEKDKLVYKKSDDSYSVIKYLASQNNILDKNLVEQFIDNIILDRKHYYKFYLSKENFFISISSFLLSISIMANLMTHSDEDIQLKKIELKKIEKKINTLNKIKIMKDKNLKGINENMDTIKVTFGNLQDIKIESLFLSSDLVKIKGKVNEKMTRNDWHHRLNRISYLNIKKSKDPFDVYKNKINKEKYFELSWENNRNAL